MKIIKSEILTPEIISRSWVCENGHRISLNVKECPICSKNKLNKEEIRIIKEHYEEEKKKIRSNATKGTK